ncbi:hypothetical protein Tco_1501383 [Tanacetum coccineum]
MGWSGLRGGLGGAAVDVIVVVRSGDAEPYPVKAKYEKGIVASWSLTVETRGGGDWFCTAEEVKGLLWWPVKPTWAGCGVFA